MKALNNNNRKNIKIMQFPNKKVSFSVFVGFLLIIVIGMVTSVSIDELINLNKC